MEFRIADTFTDSLARLTGEEQKAVKTTAFDLQLDPSAPGLSFHKLDKAKDKNFWSVRVSSDIRLIVHRTTGSLLLCYVDHHDKAYAWAERRKLETHPKTGAAQLVEIRETVREVVLPMHVAEAAPTRPRPRTPLFTQTDDELLAFGVPNEWLGPVRDATEEGILELVSHLPAEAAEALLELATGGTPRPAVPAAVPAGPFEHPDAQRRFRVIGNVEELQRALDAPWEKWTVFLHPEQRDWVERDFNGPSRVSGSAGTGKTIVALHRAVHLARANAGARILLTTFSDPLANALHAGLRRLVGGEPRLAERIDVHSLETIGQRLYKAHVGTPHVVSSKLLAELLATAAATVSGHKYSASFLLAEWAHVVDAWQVGTWEEYRDVARLGRKTRLPEAQRKVLWEIFERLQSDLQSRGLITSCGLFSHLATVVAAAQHPPFEYAVVDEAQDLSVAQMRFLAALGGSRPNALFFAGDLGQRIFQQPFSWKSLSIDVRGRARTLRVNYRTSHQIRMQADRLLGPEMVDIDGNAEKRRDTVSVFNGPAPNVRVLGSVGDEAAEVANWLKARATDGVLPHEVGVFVRSVGQIDRARAAVNEAGLLARILDDQVETQPGSVSISTMHLAKGLEFRAVVVMACDDEVIPLQERIQTVGDDADLREVYDTERHLLYVACTRARDFLLVSAVEPASEFLDDLELSRSNDLNEARR